MNPETPEEAEARELRQWKATWRGASVEGGWRNFCAQCGRPIVVKMECNRAKTDLVCDDCRPAIQTGGKMATAFSPDRKQSR